MKDFLVAMVDYNRKVNERLVGLLSGLEDATLREDQGSFYRSILGTLEHIALAETLWLRRYKGSARYERLETSPLLAREHLELEREAASSPAALYAILRQADELFIAFVGDLSEAELGRRMRYKNMKGEELEKTLWVTIFHVLNHGTHHRGELSALLDRKGIANDLSGFTLYED